MKKTLILIGILSSYSVFALEGSINTGIKLSPEFSPLVEDKANGIDGKAFRYEKSAYDAKLLDLNLKFKEIGLELGTTLKSSRSDAKISDWDGDNSDKSHYVDKREKDHDVMAKIYGKYASPVFYGLKNETDFTYYVDNFWQIRSRDSKESSEIKDSGRYAEYIEEDGTKQALGNMVLNTKLSGKVLDKVDLSANLNYKANQIDRFDKDESYFKGDIEASGKIGDKTNLKGKYNFDLDLDFGAKKFDPLTTDLDEYPDFWGGNYITLLDQGLDLSADYKLRDDIKINTNLNTTFKTYIQGGITKSQKTRSEYNIIKPILEVGIEKDVVKNLTLGTMIKNEFEVRNAKYIPETPDQITQYDSWSSYKPKLLFNTKYDNSLIKYDGKLGYGFSMTLDPFITELKHVEHEIVSENKLGLSYKFNDKTSIDGNVEANIEIPVLNEYLKSVSTKLNIDATLKHEFFKGLTLETKLDNKLDLTGEKTVLNLEKFTESFTLNNTLKYTILENDKEKLDLTGKLGFENREQFNHFIKTEKKKVGEKEVDIPLTKKIWYLGGESLPLYMINRVKFGIGADYEKKINDKLKLEAKIDVDSKLEFFALRSEKLFTYKNTENYRKSNKEKPQISDYRTTRWNIGGEIKTIGTVGIDYAVTNNLNLKGKLNSKLEFAREVINKINDDTRPDKDSFGWIDKSFGFKKFVPSVEFNLEYKW